jgi:hypothetical protein
MLGIALPINDPLRLMQLPGIVGFHALAIGVHWKMLTAMMEMHQQTDKAPRIQQPIRILRTGKMRQYMRSKDTFVRATVMT